MQVAKIEVDDSLMEHQVLRICGNIRLICSKYMIVRR